MKIPVMKLHENSSGGSHTVRCRQTEGRADMSLIVALRSLANRRDGTMFRNHRGPVRKFISRLRASKISGLKSGFLEKTETEKGKFTGKYQ